MAVKSNYCRSAWPVNEVNRKPYSDSVSLSQPYRVGQLDLDLRTVEGAKYTHHLQQAIIQPAETGNSMFTFHSTGNLKQSVPDGPFIFPDQYALK